ncbi:hypothetical protein JKP88DRAFT_337407, partial [Tribonema minus]
MALALGIAEGRVALSESWVLDVVDFTAILNSDNETVLVQGLGRAAAQIRREHDSLLLPEDRDDVADADGGGGGGGAASQRGGASDARSSGAPLGLLGAYLAASPDAAELFVLFDLDQRNKSRALTAAHTDLLAAAVACLAAAARGRAASAATAAGAALCRRLLKERLPALQQQLAGAGGEAAERATLALLAALARFNRTSARELSRHVAFGGRAFARLAAKRGAAAAAPSAAAAAALALLPTVRGIARSGDGDGEWRPDVRHACVRLLAALFDGGDAAVRARLLAPAARRPGSAALSQALRAPLAEDAAPTALLVLRLMDQYVLRAPVQRSGGGGGGGAAQRARVSFFCADAMDALRAAAFESPHARVRKRSLTLLTALLTDAALSPFLSHAAGVAAAGAGAAAAAALPEPPRAVARAALLLPAQSDAAARALLVAVLRATPPLLAPFLESLSAASLEPRATPRCLRGYALLAEVLRCAPLPRGDLSGAAAAALAALVLPPALGKKEFTKGILSPSPLVQASTLTLLCAALARAGALLRRLSAAADARAALSAQLRAQLPEVQTILALRARLDPFTAPAAAAAAAGSAAVAAKEAAGAMGGDGATEETEAQETQTTYIYGRALAALRLYARHLPAAVDAARFDLLKLLPPAAALAAAPPLLRRALLALLAEARAPPGAWLAAPKAAAAAGGGGGDGAAAASAAAAAVKPGEGVAAAAPAKAVAAAVAEAPLAVVLRAMLAAERGGEGDGERAAARQAAISGLLSTGLFCVAGAAAEGEAQLWVDERRRMLYDLIAPRDVNLHRAQQTVSARPQRIADAPPLPPPPLPPQASEDGIPALLALTQAAHADRHRLALRGIEGAERGARALGAALAPDFNIEFSPLLVAALDALAAGGSSSGGGSGGGGGSGSGSDSGGGGGSELRRLAANVAFRSLHLHADPAPLAGVIESALGGAAAAAAAAAHVNGGTGDMGLARYARALLGAAPWPAEAAALSPGDFCRSAFSAAFDEVGAGGGRGAMAAAAAAASVEEEPMWRVLAQAFMPTGGGGSGSTCALARPEVEGVVARRLRRLHAAELPLAARQACAQLRLLLSRRGGSGSGGAEEVLVAALRLLSVAVLSAAAMDTRDTALDTFGDSGGIDDSPLGAAPAAGSGGGSSAAAADMLPQLLSIVFGDSFIVDVALRGKLGHEAGRHMCAALVALLRTCSEAAAEAAVEASAASAAAAAAAEARVWQTPAVRAFLEALCAAAAAAALQPDAKGDDALRALAAPLHACADRCGSAALSRVVRALLHGLHASGCGADSIGGGDIGGGSSGSGGGGGAARALLEQLLEQAECEQREGRGGLSLISDDD